MVSIEGAEASRIPSLSSSRESVSLPLRTLTAPPKGHKLQRHHKGRGGEPRFSNKRCAWCAKALTDQAPDLTLRRDSSAYRCTGFKRSISVGLTTRSTPLPDQNHGFKFAACVRQAVRPRSAQEDCASHLRRRALPGSRLRALESPGLLRPAPRARQPEAAVAVRAGVAPPAPARAPHAPERGERAGVSCLVRGGAGLWGVTVSVNTGTAGK